MSSKLTFAFLLYTMPTFLNSLIEVWAPRVFDDKHGCFYWFGLLQ